MEKNKNWFLRIVRLLFIIFVCSYIVSISGYHEAKIARSVKLTDEALKEFEQDVIKGEVVDLKDYIKDDEVDYSNKFTKVGNKITNSFEYIISDGIGGIWDALKVLFFG